MDPRRTNDRIDMDEPALTKSAVLNAEPTRANARSDNDDPKCTKFSTEQVEAIRT